MRGLILALLLLVFVASVYADETQKLIDVQHDSVRGATCWILNDRAISCLPDSLLQNATPRTQKNRASPASSTPENAGPNAGSLPHDERVQP